MKIEFMLIIGAEFNYDNALYLMTLKQFNGGNTNIRESRLGIFVTCNFRIRQRDLNILRAEIKKNTQAKYVDCRIFEK